jgi:hypothetical protein
VAVAAVEVFEESIVDGGLADYVFLAGPVAEVEELAAFAAEREFRDGRGVRGLFADGAAEFHAIKSTAKFAGMRIVASEEIEVRFLVARRALSG